MSPDRRTSIPLHTGVSLLRLTRSPITIQIGGGGLGNLRRVPHELQDLIKVVDNHLYGKPPRQRNAGPKPRYERDDRIGWEAEIAENYDNKGNLGVILQFTGIGLTSPFLRGKRDYGHNTTLLYALVSYRNRRALLMLATTGDIFEAQVVPNRKDVNPFFQKELHLPQLMSTYDPASMAARQNNGLVIVSYNRNNDTHTRHG